MPALVAGIHTLLCVTAPRGVDGRDKPGHDDSELFCKSYSPPPSPGGRRGAEAAAWTGTVRMYEMIASI
jgi:hypothetical protein